MTEYTLYLDESYNVERKQFLVAGFAIDLNKIDIVDKGIESIKSNLWNNVSEDFDNVVLHCTEIMNIYNNRKNPNLKRNINRNGYEKFLEYTPEDLKNKIENMNIELCKIVRNQEITVFGCLIDEDTLDLYYGNKSQHDDKYNIAIESIIENYIHFLNKRNAIGNIVYEARDFNQKNIKSPDVMMKHNFHSIMSQNKGIIGTKLIKTQEHIRGFNIVDKKDDTSGLELADFICYYLLKAQNIDENNKNEFIKTIEKSLYNGDYDIETYDLRYFYGMKKFPFDVLKLVELQKNIKTMKNSIKNHKRYIKKLEKKNKQLMLEKQKLQHKYDEVIKKIE